MLFEVLRSITDRCVFLSYDVSRIYYDVSRIYYMEGSVLKGS